MLIHLTDLADDIISCMNTFEYLNTHPPLPLPRPGNWTVAKTLVSNTKTGTRITCKTMKLQTWNRHSFFSKANIASFSPFYSLPILTHFLLPVGSIILCTTHSPESWLVSYRRVFSHVVALCKFLMINDDLFETDPEAIRNFVNWYFDWELIWAPNQSKLQYRLKATKDTCNIA